MPINEIQYFAFIVLGANRLFIIRGKQALEFTFGTFCQYETTTC